MFAHMLVVRCSGYCSYAIVRLYCASTVVCVTVGMLFHGCLALRVAVWNHLHAAPVNTGVDSAASIDYSGNTRVVHILGDFVRFPQKVLCVNVACTGD